MIEDEDAGDEDDRPITCPVCGVLVDDGCDHALAVIDVTFGYCRAGYAYEHWHTFVGVIADAFKGFLRDGAHPNWDHFELHDAWDEMVRAGESTPDEVHLTSSAVVRLIADALCQAGGEEIHGSLFDQSGAYCESSLRLFYAADPAETCERAEAILKEWLVKEKEKPKKRTRRKKR
jgi:L-alanine-DL-glutamate epimerase-like enolase superfamily enzyme